MVIVMKPEATEEQLRQVIAKIEELGYKPHVIYGATRNVIGAVGDERGKFILQSLEVLDGVEAVIPILKPYKLASKEVKKEKTIINVGDISIGGSDLIIIAGPCAVENQEQIVKTAMTVKSLGAHILRGGAYKPRTSPYAFQGLGEEGLKLLKKASEISKMPVVTEVINPEHVDLVCEYVDILQIGTRNAQNFELLKRVGQADKPVILKRGMSMTIKEWLMSAEYILSEGNMNVILCERGIRTFETSTRNTLDLSAIVVLKEETHLPVIVDPSHATGYAKYVLPMALAAVAAGADGLMIEVHPNPEKAFSDGPQSLNFDAFGKLTEKIKKLTEIIKEC
ncbi:2-keto-3-deoxy-D-arabino-heptulosonate-7-phosphate synthase I beta [Thermodesulfovibrio sp. N1]|uniref:3-deoxy-7-phosphoheptulonate synthase n=1 Tax=unclassified Thermodesulfovibrio TaxID=2645936 RepID=UPI000839F731|nr:MULTISPECIES: 3-deoxy-7-phosphoheptulonate synthase [unclassified Thermodesulfovibrio]MDI1471151.1 3-deoxy-7-phosphoheptulonate synthase [Thermodesulfovibrio sp. 1176]ODA45010.1 2-keto-3-deoxy-D-arabino-heptulosonate-7-phosphate synthase I beta [Thermodesulfovibrio sp. N1]